MDFITFCGFMIFVYIVRNLILSLETILCISLIDILFVIETYKKFFRLPVLNVKQTMGFQKF